MLKFILFNLFRWNISFCYPFVSLIYSFISYFGFSISLFLVPYSFKLFSCLTLSSCLAVLIIIISYSLFLLNCANSVLFLVCSLTASLISAVCILDCCCLPGPKKLKRLGVEPDAANLCQSLKKIVLRNFDYHTTILTNRFFLL